MAIFPEAIRAACLHRFHHSGVLIEAWSIAEFPEQRCHLFHLFYQVQIRLGSPRSSPGCFCSQITAIASPRPLTRRPASALSRSA
jgi:hypothetical protein